jgi:hypothetical protein
VVDEKCLRCGKKKTEAKKTFLEDNFKVRPKRWDCIVLTGFM